MSERRDTDPMTLDDWRSPQPQPPLSDYELKRLRKVLQDDDRATWLRRQVRVFTPWLIAIVGAIATAVAWVQSHWKA